MRCCLCPNEENLLVNVVNDSGLILIFCRECEDTPALEAAARLAVENEKLSCEIKSLRGVEIKRLRDALESICSRHDNEGSCDCFVDEEDDETILCDYHIARAALEDK